MDGCSSNVWLWGEPIKQSFFKVLDHINTSKPSDKAIIVLNCQENVDFGSSIPVTNYFFNLSLKLNLIEDERMMFLNLKDMISSIELYLERQKKNKNSENGDLDEEIGKFYEKYVASFTTNNSDESITLFKAFLKQNNCIDVMILYEQYIKCNTNVICTHIEDFRYLILGKPCSSILKQFIKILNEKICCIYLETPLDTSLLKSPSSQQTSEEMKIVVESIELNDIAVDSEYQSVLGSATEEYVEDIILSFLSLLVNSRNELILSKAMISPLINLSHDAFTTLKHLSVEKEMPMCQVAISYVTRIRLGGKGYAPPTDCPMLPHLKSLELFVDILNQMQTLIEEESCPSTAIKRLINVLRKKLLKCGHEKLKESSVETVSETLKSTYLAITDFLEDRVSDSNLQSCQKNLDILYHFINFINCSCFIHDPDVILSKKQMKRTPLNLPPLLGYFRSPEEESSCDTKLSLNEDSVQSRNSLIQPPAVSSYFHQSESSEVSISCINSSTPSKITFKGCLKEGEENVQKQDGQKMSEKCFKNPLDRVSSNNKRRRSILGEITNEQFSSEAKNETMHKVAKKDSKTSENFPKETIIKRPGNKNVKKEPKKSRKKFKLIQGQGKITSFFIQGKTS